MTLPPKVIELGKRIEEFLRADESMNRGVQESIGQGKVWPAGWLGIAGQRKRLLRELLELEQDWSQVSASTVTDLNTKDEVLAEIARLQSQMDGHMKSKKTFPVMHGGLLPATSAASPQYPGQVTPMVSPVTDTLTRAKNLLPTLRGKDKRHVEAWIYREEQGCTVDDLASHLNRAKRTAEAYLTEARNLLSQT